MTRGSVLCRLTAFLSLLALAGRGQPPPSVASPIPADSSNIVRIVKADRLTMVKVDSASERYILAGRVQLRQGNTLFYCDSAVKDERTNLVEAFGNIHINDGDTIHTYAQYLRYPGDTRVATLKRKVRLTDGKGVLTTEELQYDVNTGVGTYEKGGKVVNGSTVLTSREGQYFSDTREVVFRKDVVLKDPEYDMTTDTLLYSIDREVATFVSPTDINDGRTRIRTRSGYYDLKTGSAQFGSRPVIQDSTQQVIADDIRYDKRKGSGTAEGNVLYRDTAQGVTILAGLTEFNNETKEVTASRKPVMILRQDNDSIYVSADTLKSLAILDSSAFKRNPGKLSQGKGAASDESGRDTVRTLLAYHRVRIFSDSLQGVCDSLAYSTSDSVFRFFRDPILWARESQLSGDTILLYTKNRKPERILVLEKGFSVNKTPESFFNQLRGNTLNGIFKDGSIDYLRAKGNAESLYYLQDEDSSYFGLNYAKADAISMYFRDKELKRVSWVNGVEGTTYPIRQIPDDKRRLRDFQWQEAKRPKSRYELFLD
jgi:lipopolysaccharide export system protein LptA